MAQRIEMNVTTGERKVIDLTPEEVADAQARASAEVSDRAAIENARGESNNIEKVNKVLLMCIAQVGGLTPAQARTLFRQKWDSLA